MKHNNKGFTLVELIVVVAILAILAGVIGLSVGTVSRTRARKAANAISDLMSQCKILTLSGENDPCVKVYAESDGAYWAELTVKNADGTRTAREKEKLGSTALGIQYKTDAVHDPKDAPLYIAYDRGTGALLPQDEAAAKAGVPGLTDTNSCVYITVGSYTITLTPLTGHHTLA